ncbi:MAG: 50S ribosomal protein L9 [Anaerolineaceae bacterium]|nr:50S ribosomal protein L9 [Anaerolineaceae bacterium]
MKVLLLKDVYKLGRAGEIKKVANGFGRNYLIPQKLAIIATPGAVKQSSSIRVKADERRAVINKEMEGIASQINGLVLTFSSKAGETGKLYGSITPQSIADGINAKLGTEINRRDIEVEPIRMLGEHKAAIRLTVDLVPEVKVVIFREGEAVIADSTKKTAGIEEVVDAAPEVDESVEEENVSTEGSEEENTEA